MASKVYCPACDNPYDTMVELREHIKKAQTEGSQIHIDIAELEGWDEKITEVPTENWPGSQIVEEGMN